MKIVIDARESGTSTGRYIDKLIEYLHKLKPNQQVIILAKAERLEFLASIAPSFIVIETPFKEFTLSEQIGFRRQLNGLEADLVHFGMVQQPVLYSGKVITTMHDLTTARFRNPSKNLAVFWFRQQVYKLVNVRAAHKSVAIITPTEFVKKDVANYTHVTPEKITVTYEAADMLLDESQPISELVGKQFIMYVGRPTPHKNLGRLIDAYKILKQTHPDLKLVLAGKKDALYQKHADDAQKKGIAGIIFTGFISDAQLRWLYENCSVYAFPSLSEGFGLPGVEAMKHGAPVAASNATCLPEVLGEAAHYFDPLDVADIVNKLSEVIDNETLRHSLIEKGKMQSQKYSWRRMAQQTLELYTSVLK